MEFYRKRPEMKGSEGTIKFMKHIADLIHAFNSRNGKLALRPYDTPERQVLDSRDSSIVAALALSIKMSFKKFLSGHSQFH